MGLYIAGHSIAETSLKTTGIPGKMIEMSIG